MRGDERKSLVQTPKHKKAPSDFSARGLMLFYGGICYYCLDKPGGDLLSRALRQSTIGAERLNDRVRNGIGWGPLAITTRLMQAIIR